MPIMATNRFEMNSKSSEIIPLLHSEGNIATEPSVILIHETQKPSTGLFNHFLHRSKPNSSVTDLTRKVESYNLNVNSELEEIDPCDSSLHLTNKFLHELRLKRRELLEKTKHLSIEQRIALHRRPVINRAEDIFAIYFELNNDQNDIFNEHAQEKIRNDIFEELNRQRMKEFHKHHRQLLCGRAFLMFVLSLLVFMSITLIYVVIHLYDRAKYLEDKLLDKEFRAIVYDVETNN